MSDYGIDDLGMDDEEASNLSENTRFKAKEGEVYRASLAMFPISEDGDPDLDKAPRWKKAFRHFVENVGYVLSQGPEWDSLAMRNGSKGRQMRLATIMILWPTDKHGGLQKSAMKTDWSIKTLVISKEKFTALLDIHKEWGLGSADIKISCTDTTYQKMTFSPCREHVLRGLLGNPKASGLKTKLLAAVQEAIDNNLQKDIGQILTLEAFKERLGVGSGTPVAPASAENIDDMMDNLLDEDDDSLV